MIYNGSDQPVKQYDIMFAVANLVIGISSIVLNSLVMAAYVQMNWRHPTNLLFINITFHDAVSGFTGVYMGIFLFFNRPEELEPSIDFICKLMGFVWSLTAFTTPTLLGIASLYRFMAIYFPYSFKDWVNFKWAMVGVILGWLVGLLSALSPYFVRVPYSYYKELSVCDVMFKEDEAPKHFIIIFIVVPLLVPLFILILCNATVLLHLCQCTKRASNKVGKVAKNRPVASDSQDDTLKASTTHIQTHNVPQFGAVCEWRNRAAKRDYHVAITVVLMTLNYICCYGLWLVYFVHRVLRPSEPLVNSGSVYLDASIKLLACLNSVINAIVHIVRGSIIRNQIGRILHFISESSQ